MPKSRGLQSLNRKVLLVLFTYVVAGAAPDPASPRSPDRFMVPDLSNKGKTMKIIREGVKKTFFADF